MTPKACSLQQLGMEKAASQVQPSMWEEGCLLTAEVSSRRKGPQHPKQAKQGGSVLADDPSRRHPACLAACSATFSRGVLFHSPQGLESGKTLPEGHKGMKRVLEK